MGDDALLGMVEIRAGDETVRVGTFNGFGVGADGRGLTTILAFGKALTRANVANLAAWLLVVSNIGRDDFERVRAAIERT